MAGRKRNPPPPLPRPRPFDDRERTPPLPPLPEPGQRRKPQPRPMAGSEPAQKPKKRRFGKFLGFGVAAMVVTGGLIGTKNILENSTSQDRRWAYEILKRRGSEPVAEIYGIPIPGISKDGLDLIRARFQNEVIKENRKILQSNDPAIKPVDRLRATVRITIELQKYPGILNKLRSLIQEKEIRGELIDALAVGAQGSSMLGIDLKDKDIRAAFDHVLAAFVSPGGDDFLARTAEAVKDKRLEALASLIKPGMRWNEITDAAAGFLQTDVGQNWADGLVNFVGLLQKPDIVEPLLKKYMPAPYNNPESIRDIQDLAKVATTALKNRDLRNIVLRTRMGTGMDGAEETIIGVLGTDAGQKAAPDLLDIINRPGTQKNIITWLQRRPASLSEDNAAKIGGMENYAAILNTIAPKLHIGILHKEGIKKPDGQQIQIWINGSKADVNIRPAIGELLFQSLFKTPCVVNDTNRRVEEGIPLLVSIEWKGQKITGYACGLRTPLRILKGQPNLLQPMQFGVAGHATMTVNDVHEKAIGAFLDMVQTRMPLLPPESQKKVWQFLFAMAPDLDTAQRGRTPQPTQRPGQAPRLP